MFLFFNNFKFKKTSNVRVNFYDKPKVRVKICEWRIEKVTKRASEE